MSAVPTADGAHTVLHMALPVPLRKYFDYLPPAGVATDVLQPGMRLEVPFHHRQRIGVLTAVTTASALPITALHHAARLLDHQPLWPPQLLQLLHWASAYYQHPIGAVLHTAMPRLLRRGAALPDREEPPAATNTPPESQPLNAWQQQAVDQLHNSTGCHLLEGVTDSGKTEVYMQTIQPILQSGRQALILLPEIGMTPQNLERFATRFVTHIAVLHSAVTAKKQLQAWMDARSGAAAIVIGTRSAVWTPLARPGIIIVDEEHDRSYRQSDNMRYSARDIAVVRARMENIPVVLGSATPSLESLLNSKRHRYHHLRLPQRVGNRRLPRMQVLDLRRCRMHGAISPMLASAISKQLEQRQQVLLFLNQRGYARLLLCHECGQRELCPHCDRPLTLHRSENKLRCHHCGLNRTRPEYCKTCGLAGLVELGHGTERIEESLAALYPTARILRIDSDLLASQRSRKTALQRIHSNAVDILVGTQMIATGHHFEGISLVGILDADRGLYSPDFRAAEQLAQQIIQVGGRSGRGDTPGTVLIQSHLPEHPLLRALLRGGYRLFSRIALAERRITRLPPYVRMALLHAESKQPHAPAAFLRRAGNQAPAQPPTLQISGPFPALFPRRADYHRWHLIIMSHRSAELQDFLQLWLPSLERARARGVRWTIEVDPVGTL